jgi:cytochrome c
MTRTIMRRAVLVTFALATGTALLAAERGTPAEAKAMLAKAVAHYKAVGRTQALADFNAKKEPFGDRDLYVFCLGPDNVQVANGGYPSLVGRTADTVTDVNGKPMGKAIWDAVNKGAGSVRYKWYNPVSTMLEPKIAFAQKVGDDVCGVGAYTP